MENLYRVLGVPEDAAEDDLKLAYRKLAKKYHPDANPGDRECEKRFQAINEAYSILSSPEKRKKYDAEYRRRAGAHRARELHTAPGVRRARELHTAPRAQRNSRRELILKIYTGRLSVFSGSIRIRKRSRMSRS